MTNVDIVRKAQSEFLASGRPDIKTGMEVEVYQIIKEGNKERIQRFKGIKYLQFTLQLSRKSMYSDNLK